MSSSPKRRAMQASVVDVRFATRSERLPYSLGVAVRESGSTHTSPWLTPSFSLTGSHRSGPRTPTVTRQRSATRLTRFCSGMFPRRLEDWQAKSWSTSRKSTWSFANGTESLGRVALSRDRRRTTHDTLRGQRRFALERDSKRRLIRKIQKNSGIVWRSRRIPLPEPASLKYL